LTLIDAIALLHQHQRERKTATRGGGGTTLTYIEATEADIAAANRLAAEVLTRSLDELPPQTRRFLTVLDQWITGECAARRIAREAFRFLARGGARRDRAWGYPGEVPSAPPGRAGVRHRAPQRTGPGRGLRAPGRGRGERAGRGGSARCDPRVRSGAVGVFRERSAPGRGAVGGRSDSTNRAQPPPQPRLHSGAVGIGPIARQRPPPGITRRCRVVAWPRARLFL
jgi:hypothetical protein